MAQVLKDDFRNAIVDAAKQEFLSKGYKGASMRSIADKAHMTVGNLYRYFKSKEEISLYIVGPTYKKIGEVLKSLNFDNIQMQPRVFNMKPDKDELIKVFDLLTDRLVKIYIENPIEFNILILHSKMNEEFISWLTIIVDSLISDSFVMNDISQDKDALIKTYVNSMYEGIRTIFKNADEYKIKLNEVMKIFFRSYINMLDVDLRKYSE